MEIDKNLIGIGPFFGDTHSFSGVCNGVIMKNKATMGDRFLRKIHGISGKIFSNNMGARSM